MKYMTAIVILVTLLLIMSIDCDKRFNIRLLTFAVN